MSVGGGPGDGAQRRSTRQPGDGAQRSSTRQPGDGAQRSSTRPRITVALPTADDTAALGRRLGAALEPGDLVVLSGPLGAGKTCLAVGLGDGLGVEGPVTSPTFVIAREHPSEPGGRGLTMVHVDAYRLGAGPGEPDVAAQLEDLDLDTDLTRAAVVVEWGEGAVEHLADEHLLVRLDRQADDHRTAVLDGPARLVGPAVPAAGGSGTAP